MIGDNVDANHSFRYARLCHQLQNVTDNDGKVVNKCDCRADVRVFDGSADHHES